MDELSAWVRTPLLVLFFLLLFTPFVFFLSPFSGGNLEHEVTCRICVIREFGGPASSSGAVRVRQLFITQPPVRADNCELRQTQPLNLSVFCTAGLHPGIALSWTPPVIGKWPPGGRLSRAIDSLTALGFVTRNTDSAVQWSSPDGSCIS